MWKNLNPLAALTVLLAMGVLFSGAAANASGETSSIKPMVSLGYQHALALRDDGRVVSWGSDQKGQLASGQLTYESRPALITKLSKIQRVASGVEHSLALRSDGTVWTWGFQRAWRAGRWRDG